MGGRRLSMLRGKLFDGRAVKWFTSGMTTYRIGPGPAPEPSPVLWGPDAEERRLAYLRAGVRPFFYSYLRGCSTQKLVDCVDELVTVDPAEFAETILTLRLEIAYRGDGPCPASVEGCAREREVVIETLGPDGAYCEEHDGRPERIFNYG
jgi:hypothetical protein